jgi:AcrR family transcriptional regulator
MAHATPDDEPGRRERKRLQTLDHIADTAWTLFETDGFEQVTMERIAQAADVAKGTLYKYFPVKEAILRHYMHRQLADSMSVFFKQIATLPSAEAQLRAFFASSAEWSARNRRYLLPYIRFRLNERVDDESRQRSGVDRVFAQIIVGGQARGELHSQRDPAALAAYLGSLYLAAMMRWLLDERLTLTEEFDLMLEIFLFGTKQP